MFQVGQPHSDYFDNLNKVGSVVDCLICDCSTSVFTAYLHSSRGDVSFFAR